MSITIHGASDDLIEVGGDLTEEFYHVEDGPTWLAFSDGTVLRVEYTSDGLWRINRDRAGKAKYSKEEAVSADDDRYSDTVILEGEISWVVAGSGFAAKAPHPTERIRG